jgi:hypothetical protein
LKAPESISPHNGNETIKMGVHVHIWPLLVAAAVSASLCAASVVPLVNNDRLPSTRSTAEALPSSSITGNPSYQSSVCSKVQDATSHVSIQNTTDTTSIATTTTSDTDKSPTAAEPDASLEIAFLVLGVLLAFASVVVALFFGFKQLTFIRTQSNIGRNDEHDSGSGADLEMGPVTGDASEADLATSPPASA